jgi:fumarate hydratase class I
VAAGGVLPMCQDTGTAIVLGKKGQWVVTGGGDEEAIARGVFATYEEGNLRYSQLAPLDTYREKNTGNNLPAQIELFATDGDAYKFLFMAKAGAAPTRATSTKRPRRCSTRRACSPSSKTNCARSAPRPAPPYHLAVVIGGTSAELTLKVAKLASARYLDALPREGNELGRGFRDVALEQAILELSRKTGIGAQSAASISATTCAS